MPSHALDSSPQHSLKHSYVITGDASVGEGVFWSEWRGWGPLESARIYHVDEHPVEPPGAAGRRLLKDLLAPGQWDVLQRLGAYDHEVCSFVVAGGYQAIMATQASQLAHQDMLDSVMQRRIIDVRNAFRDIGYSGALRSHELTWNEGQTSIALQCQVEQVGAGRNLVGCTFVLTDVSDRLKPTAVATHTDDLTLLPETLAAQLQAEALRQLAPITLEDAVSQLQELFVQAGVLWERIDEQDRAELDDACFPGISLGDAIVGGRQAAEAVLEDLVTGRAPQV